MFYIVILDEDEVILFWVKCFIIGCNYGSGQVSMRPLWPLLSSVQMAFIIAVPALAWVYWELSKGGGGDIL